MKKFLGSIAGIIAMSTTLSAWAVMPTGSTPPTGPSAMTMGGGEHNNGHRPCKALEDACKSAGYFKGGASKGKGLFENCLKPMMDGREVAGVRVDRKEIEECKAKKQMMDEHMQQHRQGGSQPGQWQQQGGQQQPHSTPMQQQTPPAPTGNGNQ